jgi:hypothetical protein
MRTQLLNDDGRSINPRPLALVVESVSLSPIDGLKI